MKKIEHFLLAAAASLLLTSGLRAADIHHIGIEAAEPIIVGSDTTLALTALDADGNALRRADGRLDVALSAMDRAEATYAVTLEKGRGRLIVPISSRFTIVAVTDSETGKVSTTILRAESVAGGSR